MAIAPVKPYRIQAYLLGPGDRYLSWSDCTGHHFKGIIRRCMMGLTTDCTGALFAQQIEGIYTTMSISPLNSHSAIGNMHFNVRRISFAWGLHEVTILSSSSCDSYTYLVPQKTVQALIDTRWEKTATQDRSHTTR
jgi:hypothetical protein